MSRTLLALLGLLAANATAPGDEAAATAKDPFASVAELKASHDRALLKDLADYLKARPDAEDRDQAYLTLFETAIEHDWFLEHEEIAKTYLARFPDGPVRSLARIVATMAKAQADKFAEAADGYRRLVAELTEDDQEEFAAEFADNLANLASSAGEYDVARQVYDTLLDRFGKRQELRDKVKDDLDRLDMIGKSAPTVIVKDIDGRILRLSDLKGKYVLFDFWATWCAPCLAELPNLQAAYAKYREKGLEVVSVSLDDKAETVADFVKARKLPWRQVHNPTCTADLVEAFRVNNIPATFLVGPDGKILRLELRGETLGKTLSGLLK